MEQERVLSLDFGCFLLSLDSRPESPALLFEEGTVRVPSRNPSWEHHLKGATVKEVRQAGLDRVLITEFERGSRYDTGPCLLIFELTGRNANIILARKHDRRIIACVRKVGSNRNRYRTIAPGVEYRPPPPSGLPPEQWHSADLPGSPSPPDLCRALEGVGPRAAGAILLQVERTGGTLREVLSELAADLAVPVLPGWLGSPAEPPLEAGKERPAYAELSVRLIREGKDLLRRIAASKTALESLEQPATFRLWGNLILQRKACIQRGMENAALADYGGGTVEIPLKRDLGPVENAERYFRKAAGVHKESERLEARIEAMERRLEEVRVLIREVPGLPPETVAGLLSKPGRTQEPRRPREYTLDQGWRCIAGRNARENQELTFRTASRDDFWLHARGSAGSHVILRRDGRPGNPPEKVLQQAADIAAKHSGQRGIVPVDCTLVKYVRRVKGAPPGYVTYTRERTLFATVE